MTIIIIAQQHCAQVAEVLRTAGVLKELDVPLFWFSNYDGVGDVAEWLPEEQAEFWDSGARFLRVNKMVESLKYLTKVKYVFVSSGSAPASVSASVSAVPLTYLSFCPFSCTYSSIFCYLSRPDRLPCLLCTSFFFFDIFVIQYIFRLYLPS